eukprot:scaffold105153_cov18-Tisochrysis_lutea.AAC.2
MTAIWLCNSGVKLKLTWKYSDKASLYLPWKACACPCAQDRMEVKRRVKYQDGGEDAHPFPAWHALGTRRLPFGLQLGSLKNYNHCLSCCLVRPGDQKVASSRINERYQQDLHDLTLSIPCSLATCRGKLDFMRSEETHLLTTDMCLHKFK